MNIKTDHNLPKNCMDAGADLFKDYLPVDNVSADSCYAIHKLVYSLGLPSLTARTMNIKTDHNLPENCMDAWVDFLKEYLPEDNVSADSYYEFQK